MEVVVIEAEAFKAMQAMFNEVVRLHKELADDAARRRDKRLLTAKEVAEMVGYRYATIKLKKHEIGFFSEGKDVKFKLKDVEAWIDRNYIKPRFQPGYNRNY